MIMISWVTIQLRDMVSVSRRKEFRKTEKQCCLNQKLPVHFSKKVDVFDRYHGVLRKDSALGQAKPKAVSMASKTALEIPSTFGLVDPSHTQLFDSSKIVGDPFKFAKGFSLASSRARPVSLPRRFRRRLGGSLRGIPGKWSVVLH